MITVMNVTFESSFCLLNTNKHQCTVEAKRSSPFADLFSLVQIFSECLVIALRPNCAHK